MPFRQKILLGILAAVVIYAVYSAFFTGPNIAPPAAVTPTQQQASSSERRQAAQQSQEGRQQSAQSGAMLKSASPGSTSVALVTEWGPRDPFYRQVIRVEEKTVQESNAVEGLVLQGIQWSKGEAIIIINDEILNLNDTINGMRIVRAGIDFVVLQNGIKQFTLRLGGNNE